MVPLEIQDVVEVRPPPAIDGLVVVPHHAEIAVPAAEKIDDLVLRLVRVLILVHQNIAPESLVILQHVGAVPEQVDRQHQEVVEVHRLARLEPLLVEAVDLRRPFFREIRRHPGVLARSEHLVLCAADPRRHRARAHHPLAQAQPLQAVLDQAQLVGVVVDHEAVPEAQLRMPFAQNADAGGVKRPQRDVQAARAQELLHALAHLVGGLVGECHRQDLPRWHAATRDQVGDASRDDAGLAGPGAGQDQERAVAVLHRLSLRRIEIGQNGIFEHRPMNSFRGARLPPRGAPATPSCRPAGSRPAEAVGIIDQPMKGKNTKTWGAPTRAWASLRVAAHPAPTVACSPFSRPRIWRSGTWRPCFMRQDAGDDDPGGAVPFLWLGSSLLARKRDVGRL